MSESPQLWTGLIRSLDFIGDDLVSKLLEAARGASDDKPIAAWGKKLLDHLGDYEIESRALVKLADTGRIIQVIQRGIDTSLHLLNIHSTTTRDEWYSVLESERVSRIYFYEELLTRDEDLVLEMGDGDQQLEILTLLKHGVNEFTSVLTPRELDTISAVFDTLVRRANLIIGRLPTWFVASSPDGARRSSVYDGEEACVRQAAALAILHHPHVRKFFGGCHVGSPFVLHEEDWMGPFTWSFYSDCAVGLDYIHRRGFIHKEMKDETLRYNKTAKRGILSGMGLVRLQDGANQNDTNRALQTDIVSFGKAIYSALASSRGYGSLARGSELPHDKPDFVKEEEWSLLLSFGAVDSLSGLVKRMRDLDKTQRIEKHLQQEYFDGEYFQILERPVDDIRSFILQSAGRTIAEILQDIDELCDQVEEFTQVNRCVYERLIDLYGQLVAYTDPLPAGLVEDFSLIVWDFYRKLEKRYDPYCSASSLCLSRTIANRNYSLQQDIDKLISSGSGILISSELHRWVSPYKLLRRTQQEPLASLAEDTVDSLSDVESDDGEEKAVEDSLLPTWFIPVEEVNRKNAIDSGAFGAVYAAKWLGTNVVVKQVLTDQTKIMNRHQFFQEADLWFMLNHKNLLQLYGANHLNNPFFVCEHAIGKTLPEFLKRERGKRLDECILHAALGLENLHARGIIHGDLKGNNILVCLAHETDIASAVTKLADFGLSFFAERASSSIYKGALGAFQWKAPECLLGEAPTFASDIFSLGMCFLEAATGTYPWGKIPDSVVRENVTKGKMLPPCPEELSWSLWNLISQMCYFDSRDRINASAVVNILRNGSFHGAPVLYTTTSYPRDRTNLISAVAHRPAQSNRWHRRNRPKKVIRTPDRLGDYVVALRNDFVLNHPVCRRGLNLSRQLRAYESETRVLFKLAATGRVVNILLCFGCVVESYVEVMELEKTWEVMQWREQLSLERQERVHRFQQILSDEQCLLEFMDDETQQMELLTLLKHDITTYHSILTPEELDVMSDVYDVVVRHSGIVLVGNPPSWFMSPIDLVCGSGTYYLNAVRVSKCTTGAVLQTGPGDPTSWGDQEEACLRQATVWADLKHPHVAKMLAACHVGKEPFVVHELAEPLVSNPANAQSWEPFFGWALGLQYLHECGLGYKNFDVGRLLVRHHVTACGVLRGLGLVPVKSQTSASLQDEFSSVALAASDGNDEDLNEPHSPTWSVSNDIFAFGLAIYNIRRWVSMFGDEKVLVLPQERPEFLSKRKWYLVERMCTTKPERRVSIWYVVHQLQVFVIYPGYDDLSDEHVHVYNPPISTDDFIARKMNRSVASAMPFLENKCKGMPETIGNILLPLIDRLKDLRKHVQLRENMKKVNTGVRGFVDVLDLLYDLLSHRLPGTEQLNSNVVASFCASRAYAQNASLLHHEIDRVLTVAETRLDPASTSVPLADIHDSQDIQNDSKNIHDWQLSWCKARREQLAAFQACLKNTEELKRQLSDPKARLEAQMLLQFELRKRQSSYPNSVLGAMSQALSVLNTIGGSAGMLPSWFIPPYEVVLGECIAQGSFGDVYHGKWFDTEVVVKVMKSDTRLPASSTAMELFRHETDNWFMLNHQNVVQLYGACHVGRLFFVCERAKSTSLKSHLESLGHARPGYCYGIDPTDSMQCLAQVGIGLQYLHERGLVHCDLKGNSFMVGLDGKTIKLGDFGMRVLERVLEMDKGRHPAHAFVGAVPWKAPENLEGEIPTTMSDVYSFGMCLLELISGKYPWAGLPEPAVRFHVTKRKILPPRPTQLNDQQWSLIEHMCFYEPSKRISLDAAVDMLNTFRFE